MAALSLYCEHIVYPRANKARGYLKDLNDSIFGRIAHVNQMYTLSDTAVQKSPFNVHLNRA